jgi:hypothetical protein
MTLDEGVPKNHGNAAPLVFVSVRATVHFLAQAGPAVLAILLERLLSEISMRTGSLIVFSEL